MRFCVFFTLSLFLLGCSDVEINSIPWRFQGDWIEIGENIDLELYPPTELSINADGFKMIKYRDYGDLSDNSAYNISNPAIFSKSEKSITIVNDDPDIYIREAVLTYSEGILYLNEYVSTGRYENGTVILGGGDNLKFVRCTSFNGHFNRCP